MKPLTLDRLFERRVFNIGAHQRISKVSGQTGDNPDVQVRNPNRTEGNPGIMKMPDGSNIAHPKTFRRRRVSDNAIHTMIDKNT